MSTSGAADALRMAFPGGNAMDAAVFHGNLHPTAGRANTTETRDDLWLALFGGRSRKIEDRNIGGGDRNAHDQNLL
jgi:hypothetical protein